MMFDGFCDRGEVAAVAECRRAPDIPEFPRYELSQRDSRLRYPVVAEEPVAIVAKVVPLEIRVRSHDGTAIRRRFQPRRLPLSRHIETNRLRNGRQEFPFRIERIRLGKHP